MHSKEHFHGLDSHWAHPQLPVQVSPQSQLGGYGLSAGEKRGPNETLGIIDR